MNQLYKVTGISKQAVHQYAIRQTLFDENVTNLLLDVQDLRKEHPGCGVKKMYNTLKPNFIGRDRFIELLMELGFRLKRKKNYRRTTYGSSIYFPNLIQGMKIRSPSAVWQSDITYIDLGQRFYYAVFIIDVYTKKTVGYCVSNHMRATANLSALKMALRDNSPPKIHHSDRGSQYTCKEYINLLKKHKCKISMSLSAQDNAYAERINRTIKEEYLQYWKPKDFNHLKRLTKKAIENYNNKRPHDNLANQSPISFEQKWHNLADSEKPELVIFDSR